MIYWKNTKSATVNNVLTEKKNGAEFFFCIYILQKLSVIQYFRIKNHMKIWIMSAGNTVNVQGPLKKQ